MNITFPFFIVFFIILSILKPELLSSLKDYIPILLGIVMFGMGMTLKVNQLKVVMSNPKWVITGLVLQFSVMPLLAFSLSKLFNFSDEILIGFVVLGSCPGGTASNVITYLSGANVPLSISLTLFSTFLSILITPIWIYFLVNEAINVEVLGLIKSTFWIIIFPLLDGFIIRRIFKSRVDKILNIFPKVSEFFIALIIGIILSLTKDLFNQVTELFIIAIILHNILGFSAGYFVSNYLKFPEDVKKTISIEVGMQNSGLGMTLSLLHFGKLVALPSAIFSLWHNISAFLIIQFWVKKNKI